MAKHRFVFVFFLFCVSCLLLHIYLTDLVIFKKFPINTRGNTKANKFWLRQNVRRAIFAGVPAAQNAPRPTLALQLDITDQVMFHSVEFNYKKSYQ